MGYTAVLHMDIDWTLLARYVAGDCTPSEREALERRLAESPEYREALAGMRDAVGAARHQVPSAREAELLASLRREMRSGEMPSLRVVRGATRRAATFSLQQRRPLRVWWRIAAAAAVVVGAALLTRGTQSLAPGIAAAADRAYTTARGQRLAFNLPDGSLAVLAPGSTLRVPSTYGQPDRAVRLEGEAAFTVTHDSTRPFAVHTARLVARDLGTRFVVRAYSGDGPTEVVVAEGLVAVDTFVITRGERVRVAADGQRTLARQVSLDAYFAWTEGRLVFRGAPLREVATQLSRWYDIDVRLASEQLGERLVSASVEQEPANDVVHLIAASLNMDLTRDGRVYTLRGK